jgi:microcystin-dependent protein
MSLNYIDPAMTLGVLKTSNNLTELQASLDTTYANMGLDQAIPVGVVFPFAGSTPPTGWLLCNGQSVNRNIEAPLFAVLGTTYGSASGTTFNLPDLRGRVIIGKDTTTGSANRVTDAGSGIDSKVLGAVGGQEDLGTDETIGGTGLVITVDTTNVQPSIVLNYIIRSRLSGLAPSP